MEQDHKDREREQAAGWAIARQHLKPINSRCMEPDEAERPVAAGVVLPLAVDGDSPLAEDEDVVFETACGRRLPRCI
jgi:hypothetical protein